MITTLNGADVNELANWPMLVEAIRAGHQRPPADVGDTFVGADGKTMLVRSAWINGLAAGVKAATVVPDNPGRQPPLPAVHAQIMLFDTDTGELTALIDGTSVTGWKTAADSALGSQLLSRENSETLLMVGAGAMAEPLIRAHLSVRPKLKSVLLWNRSQPRVEALAERLADLEQRVEIVGELDGSVPGADIICCATMSKEPVLKGALLKPGTHVDLVGAFKADMREADDDVHRRGDWHVDSRATTIGHIGELMIPLKAGLISEDAVRGDFHDLIAGKAGRHSAAAITVFKNGGGAHLDVMVSHALVTAARAR